MSDRPGGEVIVYRRDGGQPSVEVRLEEETMWLSQQQLADLFQTSRTNVVEHIQNIFAEGELAEEATCRDFRQVRTEGTRQAPDLSRTTTLTSSSPSDTGYRIPDTGYRIPDTGYRIPDTGYRVRSAVATQFRIWATERLREYLVKGFTMDDAKLKNLGGGAYWRELLDRIRDIRSSESRC